MSGTWVEINTLALPRSYFWEHPAHIVKSILEPFAAEARTPFVVDFDDETQRITFGPLFGAKYQVTYEFVRGVETTMLESAIRETATRLVGRTVKDGE